jgi:hypothetical protein
MKFLLFNLPTPSSWRAIHSCSSVYLTVGEVLECLVTIESLVSSFEKNRNPKYAPRGSAYRGTVRTAGVRKANRTVDLIEDEIIAIYR